jgi:hypothetical protein
MSDDNFFDDGGICDSAMMEGMDVFEARLNPGRNANDDEFEFGDPIDWTNVDWKDFDQQAGLHGQQIHKVPEFVPGSSNRFSRTSSGKLQKKSPWGLPMPPQNRHRSPQSQKGKTLKKTKTWNRTDNTKDKAKNQGGVRNLACVSIPSADARLFPQPLPMKLIADQTAAELWIYPLNKPKRDYQLNIVRMCLFDNTLVALPTGLGKTFIAGTVMLNCTSCSTSVLR